MFTDSYWWCDTRVLGGRCVCVFGISHCKVWNLWLIYLSTYLSIHHHATFSSSSFPQSKGVWKKSVKHCQSGKKTCRKCRRYCKKKWLDLSRRMSFVDFSDPHFKILQIQTHTAPRLSQSIWQKHGKKPKSHESAKSMFIDLNASIQPLGDVDQSNVSSPPPSWNHNNCFRLNWEGFTLLSYC